MQMRFFRCDQWSIRLGEIHTPIIDRLDREDFPMLVSAFYTEDTTPRGEPKDRTCVFVIESDSALPRFGGRVREITEQEARELIQSRHPRARHMDLRRRSPSRSGGSFTDNFTDTNGTLLQNHTPSGGTAWTKVSGSSDLKIEGNAVETTGNGKLHYTCDDQGSADQFSQGKLVVLQGLGQTYCCIRLVDADNLIGVRFKGTGASGLRLSKVVAGTITDLISIQGVAGSVYKAEGDGDTIKLFEDDVQQGADQTVTDHNTETSAGLRSQSTTSGGWIDDFENAALAVPQIIAPEIQQQPQIPAPHIEVVSY